MQNLSTSQIEQLAQAVESGGEIQSEIDRKEAERSKAVTEKLRQEALTKVDLNLEK